VDDPVVARKLRKKLARLCREIRLELDAWKIVQFAHNHLELLKQIIRTIFKSLPFGALDIEFKYKVSCSGKMARNDV
jgi:hypothetical protein